uniref:Uncharacterized protein n=1 Tax=Dulem virus 40 TaxID=3145758 RepID=A0AAU8AUR3_9CAUD
METTALRSCGHGVILRHGAMLPRNSKLISL